MKHKIIVGCLFAALLAGCASMTQRAVVSDGVIENSSLGFFGFGFDIPEGFELYPMSEASEMELNDLQRMAVRIHELNEEYHPSSGEAFYEEFLMLSENTAFILVTVTHYSVPTVDWTETRVELAPKSQLYPLYNVKESDSVALGDDRLAAFLAKGTAYESKGWYYSKPKAARMKFSYEACKVRGVNRDSYILMGVSQPEHEHILALQMQEMVHGFQF